MTQVKNGAATDVATFSNQKALPKTKAILNQVVADLYTAHIALHQVHWYMRGAGFMVWHPKMDEYMETLDTTLDEVSERLITLESLARVIEIFRYLTGLYQEALDVTDQEGDDVTNDIFVGAKADLEKTIWMLTAEIGQAPGL